LRRTKDRWQEKAGSPCQLHPGGLAIDFVPL
jgi:hypothetical protein